MWDGVGFLPNPIYLLLSAPRLVSMLSTVITSFFSFPHLPFTPFTIQDRGRDFISPAGRLVPVKTHPFAAQFLRLDELRALHSPGIFA